MSISAALSSALSGLTAASRGAQTVSSNIANATTEGYAVRRLELSTATVGSGVRIVGEQRLIDEPLLRDRRLADAGSGAARTEQRFLTDALALIGNPGSDVGLNADVGAFESALIGAVGRPDDPSRLAGLLEAAKDLANGLNTASDGLQALREDADAAIAAEVTKLNGALAEVDRLNEAVLGAGGSEANNLRDQRQRVIDEISGTLSIRVVEQDNGRVALYSTTGLALLETNPAEFSFTRTNPITADMTLASSALSTVSVNGSPLDIDAASSSMPGGTLAALFAFRDQAAPSLQGDLDAVAEDLIRRFEDPTLDATLLPGDAGLFTDGGGALNAADTVGLASRLGINAAIDPLAGGEVWRLRDGINAVAPGDAADGRLLTALSDRLAESRLPPATASISTRNGFGGFVADVAARFGSDVANADRRLVTADARRDALLDTERAQGVDTDQELQKLLLIEQAYAANARVIQTADQMLQILTEV